MRQEQLQLTGGGKKERRRELDYYPTPQECTIALIDFMNIELSFHKGIRRVWECACGEGAISKVLDRHDHIVYSTDLFNYGYGHSGIDYLTAKPTEKFDAIITNPPFALSEKFITKALGEACIVAMLLKSQYWHSKSRYDLFNKHKPLFVLPLTWRPNFAPDKGNAPTMEVHWTIWDTNMKNPLTGYIPLKKPNSVIVLNGASQGTMPNDM